MVLQGKLTARIWIHPIAKVHIYFLSTQLFAHFPVICMGVQSSLTILVAPTFPSYQKLVGTTRCSASLFFHPFLSPKNVFFKFHLWIEVKENVIVFLSLLIFISYAESLQSEQPKSLSPSFLTRCAIKWWRWFCSRYIYFYYLPSSYNVVIKLQLTLVRWAFLALISKGIKNPVSVMMNDRHVMQIHATWWMQQEHVAL